MRKSLGFAYTRSVTDAEGVDQPKIQRQIWSDAVLRVDERCDANALHAKILNATVGRRMITKDERMVEAGGPTLGALWEFPQSISVWVQKAPRNGRDWDSDIFPRYVSRAPYSRLGSLALRICLQDGGSSCLHRGSPSATAAAVGRKHPRNASSAQALATGVRHQR